MVYVTQQFIYVLSVYEINVYHKKQLQPWPHSLAYSYEVRDVHVGLNLCSKTVSWADVLFAYSYTATGRLSMDLSSWLLLFLHSNLCCSWLGAHGRKGMLVGLSLCDLITSVVILDLIILFWPFVPMCCRHCDLPQWSGYCPSVGIDLYVWAFCIMWWWEYW